MPVLFRERAHGHSCVLTVRLCVTQFLTSQGISEVCRDRSCRAYDDALRKRADIVGVPLQLLLASKLIRVTTSPHHSRCSEYTSHLHHPALPCSQNVPWLVLSVRLPAKSGLTLLGACIVFIVATLSGTPLWIQLLVDNQERGKAIRSIPLDRQFFLQMIARLTKVRFEPALITRGGARSEPSRTHTGWHRGCSRCDVHVHISIDSLN